MVLFKIYLKDQACTFYIIHSVFKKSRCRGKLRAEIVKMTLELWMSKLSGITVTGMNKRALSTEYV